MKIVAIAGVALALTVQVVTTQTASAADLPVKSPLQKAPATIAYDWTGVYLGGYFRHVDWAIQPANADRTVR